MKYLSQSILLNVTHSAFLASRSFHYQFLHHLQYWKWTGRGGKENTHTHILHGTLTRWRAPRIKVISSPQQAEPRFVPVSDVTSSSDTPWQMWKDSSLSKMPEARRSFQSDHQLIHKITQMSFMCCFIFKKNTHFFHLFSNKKIQPNNNDRKSTQIPSPSWEVTPRSPEYYPRLLPYFSVILTGLVWLISYVVLWL